MPRIDLSTAGTKFMYAAETLAGERPTTGYAALTGVKSIPEIGGEPNSLETTTLDETEYKTYIDGLKDPGGTIALTAGNTNQFHEDWDDLVTLYEEAALDGRRIWFVAVTPGLNKAFYFAGKPIPLGYGGAEVDSVLEITANIAPLKVEGWLAAPTI